MTSTKTFAGVPVTDELIDKLSEEAQEGYDPQRLHRRSARVEGA